MTPLFAEEWTVESVAPLHAVDKLARRGISVYNVEKLSPKCLKFRAKCKDRKKIFAIFRGSCYTVSRGKSVGLKRLADAVLLRPGMVAGAALFFALGLAGTFFVMDIRVEGSGARYEERAVQILHENGLHAFAPFSEKKAAQAGAALLKLPGIVFAEVEKSGYVVTVTLEESADALLPARKTELKAAAGGEIESLTVLRGTPLVKAGETVAEGQVLVGGFFETEEGERKDTFAVARASILHSYTGEFESGEKSEAAQARAVAAANMIAGGEPVDHTCTVRGSGKKFVYSVTVRVRIVCSVNM